MTEMTAREGMQDLIIRHADEVNLGRAKEFAENFAEDGVWNVIGFWQVEGRKAIEAQFREVYPTMEWCWHALHGTRLLEVSEPRGRHARTLANMQVSTGNQIWPLAYIKIYAQKNTVFGISSFVRITLYILATPR